MASWTVPGGNFSVPDPQAYADIVLESLGGKPRLILQLLGWRVGDTSHEQNVAAFVISFVLFIVCVLIYVGMSHCICSRHLRRLRCHPKREASSRLEHIWTIHNKRYDLRGFVNQHPGGIDAISLGQGRNCTALWESYHSLANEKLVHATLARYYVEDAPAEAPDFDDTFEWQDTPFYNTLKLRVRAHFKNQQSVLGGHHADLFQWLQLSTFVVASGVALWGFMHADVLSMLVLPLCYWWGPSPCMHDGSHFSLSRTPWVNRFLANIGGAHMSLFSWYHQHVIGHHIHTNMAGRDPDLYHFAVGADGLTPGFRTSIELRTLPEKTCLGRPRSRWWRKGLMLRIPFSTFGPSILWDIQSFGNPLFSNAFLGIVPLQMISDMRQSVHAVGRCVVIWLTIIHPITVSLVIAASWPSGALRAFLFVVVPWAIHGCLFYTFSQLSHVQHQCNQVRVDENVTWHHPHPHDKVSLGMIAFNPDAVVQHGEAEIPKAKEWAVHQVGHSLDYAVHSRFWLHISNGLNLQVVHHLFPQVAWGHYREIAAIVKEVCDDHGVTYNVQPTFWAAAASHFKHLAEINEGWLASVWVKSPLRHAPLGAMFFLDQVDTKADYYEKFKNT